MKSLINGSHVPDILIVAIILIVVVSFFIWNYIYSCDKGCWGNLISGIASLFNTLLLYLTLKRQDRSFNQERFETTFFNLLESHKKITEEIELTTCDIYETHIQSIYYKGRKCFSFATKDCSAISMALNAERHYGFLKENEEMGEEAIENKYANITNDSYIEEEKNKELKEFYSWYKCKFFNQKYNITQECYANVKKLREQQKLDINEVAYKLFFRRYHDSFEFYFRNLKQLLLIIYDNHPRCVEPTRYVKIITSQMSSDEQRLAYYYSLYDNAFKQVFDNCKVQEYLNINFKI